MVTRWSTASLDDLTVHTRLTYNRIVTGSDDRKVKVVVAETGQVTYDIALHDDWVRTVLYTKEFFISGSDDRQVMLTYFFPMLIGGIGP